MKQLVLDLNGAKEWQDGDTIPEGYRYCSGVSYLDREPHLAKFEEFYKDSRGRDGLFSRCKDCFYAVSRIWAVNNRDKTRAAQRRYGVRNTIKAAQRYEVDTNVPKHCPGRPSVGTLPHTATVGDFNRNSTNPDGLDGTCRVCNKAYRSTAARKQALHKSNAKRAAVYSEEYDFQQIWLDNVRCCHLCEQYVSPEDVVVDHIYPLSRGGTDVATNVLPAHETCNNQKNGRTMQELKDRGILDNWFRHPGYDPDKGRVIEPH